MGYTMRWYVSTSISMTSADAMDSYFHASDGDAWLLPGSPEVLPLPLVVVLTRSLLATARGTGCG